MCNPMAHLSELITVANRDHLAKLRQGAHVWNPWREEMGTSLTPDLTGADLHNADLTCANLNRALLKHADLTYANLTKARLNDADLSDADLAVATLWSANLARAKLSNAEVTTVDLTNAILHDADLTFANLRRANLTDARLNRAHLVYTNLQHTNLRNTDMTSATIGEAIFADVDFSSTVGLQTCQHIAPSMVDHRTLARSGQLPLSFLRGVGLPNNLIDYIPSILNQPIQYFSCFVSYSSMDQDFADRMYADLQNKGVRCWFAPHDMPIGGKILDEIDTAIRLRDKLLLILSEHSIKSDWVEDEVTAAFEEERKRGQTVLFPIRLDDAVMDTNEAWAAKLRAQRNIGDFRKWEDHNAYKASFDRVLRDLAPKIKRVR
jgi:hypothetical protein